MTRPWIHEPAGPFQPALLRVVFALGVPFFRVLGLPPAVTAGSEITLRSGDSKIKGSVTSLVLSLKFFTLSLKSALALQFNCDFYYSFT